MVNLGDNLEGSCQAVFMYCHQAVISKAVKNFIHCADNETKSFFSLVLICFLTFRKKKIRVVTKL